MRITHTHTTFTLLFMYNLSGSTATIHPIQFGSSADNTEFAVRRRLTVRNAFVRHVPCVNALVRQCICMCMSVVRRCFQQNWSTLSLVYDFTPYKCFDIAHHIQWEYVVLILFFLLCRYFELFAVRRVVFASRAVNVQHSANWNEGSFVFSRSGAGFYQDYIECARYVLEQSIVWSIGGAHTHECWRLRSIHATANKKHNQIKHMVNDTYSHDSRSADVCRSTVYENQLTDINLIALHIMKLLIYRLRFNNYVIFCIFFSVFLGFF